MKQAWVVCTKELNSFFDSLMASIVLIIFIGFSGFFTWFGFSSNVFFVDQANLGVFFGVAYWSLFFFIPALTMRQIAEEIRSGTIEMLLTKPIQRTQILLGKFMATMLLITIALALTLPYYFTVSNIGKIDHYAVWCGYLGLLLMSGAYTSIGLFCSSISKNQIVAFLISLFIGIFFHFLFDMIASGFAGTVGEILTYMSVTNHFDSISRGVIDSKDLIYFASIIFVGLMAADYTLAKRYN